MEILVKNLQGEKVESRLIKRLAEHVLSQEKASFNTELSVAFVDRKTIRDLNKRYRGSNTAADVLSFSFKEESKNKDSYLLGEVVISPEVAKKQAKTYRVTYERELALLLVHGVLHLLGYSDESQSSRRLMRKKEEAILKEFFKEG